jgi:hypothetical protein
MGPIKAMNLLRCFYWLFKSIKKDQEINPGLYCLLEIT